MIEKIKTNVYGQVEEPEVAHAMVQEEDPYRKKRLKIFQPSKKKLEQGGRAAEKVGEELIALKEKAKNLTLDYDFDREDSGVSVAILSRITGNLDGRQIEIKFVSDVADREFGGGYFADGYSEPFRCSGLRDGKEIPPEEARDIAVKYFDILNAERLRIKNKKKY